VLGRIGFGGGSQSADTPARQGSKGHSAEAGINKNLEGPAPGKELGPASKSFCAARPELNTIAERANIFAGIPFGLVKNGHDTLAVRPPCDDVAKPSQSRRGAFTS
jgi:hypothetical protein